MAPKTYATLISAQDLARHYQQPDWTVIDCRFSLADPEQGEHDYSAGHIPGPFYAHIDRDLSPPVVPGKTGRHPLPSVEDFAERLACWGVTPATQVVSYDGGDASIAGRLWWMLRWVGHDPVAVLDGGWRAWRDARFPTETASPAAQALPPYPVRPKDSMVVGREELREGLDRDGLRLIDARAAERFSGELEPIDPVAGHIRGAVNRPYSANLEASGLFRPPAELRSEIEQLLRKSPASDAICYCGSGVTAAHHVLAFAHAGLPLPRLYAGSWSEWITDPDAPMQTA